MNSGTAWAAGFCIGIIVGGLAFAVGQPKKIRLDCQDRHGFPILLMRTADKPQFVSATISCMEIDVPAEGRFQ